MIYLDTHIITWLFSGQVERFTPRGRKLLQEPLAVSPMVALELQYMYEIGRIIQPSSTVLSIVAKDLDLTVARHSLQEIVLEALSIDWTRDPFDRIIVAHAQVDRAPLLTKDARILEHYELAVW